MPQVRKIRNLGGQLGSTRIGRSEERQAVSAQLGQGRGAALAIRNRFFGTFCAAGASRIPGPAPEPVNMRRENQDLSVATAAPGGPVHFGHRHPFSAKWHIA